MSDHQVMCPTCRIAVPDKSYYAHAKSHQPALPERRELERPKEENND